MSRVRKRRKPAKRPRRRSRKTRKLHSNKYLNAASEIAVFVFTSGVGLLLVLAYFLIGLPDPRTVWDAPTGAEITLLASNGDVVKGAVVGADDHVSLAALPDYVAHAVIAVEDRDFYTHFGISPKAAIRAFGANIRNGRIVQGGSTITQQLAKNIFLTHERTLKRKVQEALLAVWLETRLSKDEILTLYLNRVYFGNGAYGLSAASRVYFSKAPDRLELGEAAVLAGLLKAPSRLQPVQNPAAAGERGRLVLQAMAQTGVISSAEYYAALREPVVISDARFSQSSYFADFVHANPDVRKFALSDNIIVRTTFDPRIQAGLNAGLIAGRSMIADRIGDAEVAVVILDQSGAIRAMAGGRDYKTSPFNRAVNARRQPGSAIKPFIFLTAVEQGYRPDDTVKDRPVDINGWRPDNYASDYKGEVTLEEALAMSLNAATLAVQETVGRAAVISTLRKLGWRNELTATPSLGLGVDVVSPVELAGVYAPLANGGRRAEPFSIERIETRTGALLYERAGDDRQVASGDAIALVDEMLKSVVINGTGKQARIDSLAVAGKTGTTQDGRDAWFVGYADGLVCAVWIGRDDNKPMPGVTGGNSAAVVWREVMSRATLAHHW